MGAVKIEVGCGTLMITGYQARAVASVLGLFCVATAMFFHTNFADPDQIFRFIKNVVMTGGLLRHCFRRRRAQHRRSSIRKIRWTKGYLSCSA
jgi:uncharacterized membrane protein YphA (DoxX/SURF4 family)